MKTMCLGCHILRKLNFTILEFSVFYKCWLTCCLQSYHWSNFWAEMCENLYSICTLLYKRILYSYCRFVQLFSRNKLWLQNFYIFVDVSTDGLPSSEMMTVPVNKWSLWNMSIRSYPKRTLYKFELWGINMFKAMKAGSRKQGRNMHPLDKVNL